MGATQMFITPSRGARKAMCRPSGLSVAVVRLALPKKAERGMRTGAGRAVAEGVEAGAFMAAIFARGGLARTSRPVEE